MGKHVKMCDWKKKDVEEHLDEIREQVGTPAFICRKCARVAAKEDSLCKPVPLKKT